MIIQIVAYQVFIVLALLFKICTLVVTLLKNANKGVLLMKNVYQSLHLMTEKEQIHLVAPYIRKFVQEV